MCDECVCLEGDAGVFPHVHMVFAFFRSRVFAHACHVLGGKRTKKKAVVSPYFPPSTCLFSQIMHAFGGGREKKRAVHMVHFFPFVFSEVYRARNICRT